MCRLVAEAAAWQNRARSASAPRGTLKKMREALHAGLRLGTELPQVEELRGEIRRREWEEHARKVCLIGNLLGSSLSLDDGHALVEC